MVVTTLFSGCNKHVTSVQLTRFQGGDKVVTTLSPGHGKVVATLSPGCFKRL